MRSTLGLSLKAKTKRYTFNTGKYQGKTVWFSLALDLAEVDLTQVELFISANET